jgi:energy-converting hydrogenase Eha subunit F
VTCRLKSAHYDLPGVGKCKETRVRSLSAKWIGGNSSFLGSQILISSPGELLDLIVHIGAQTE